MTASAETSDLARRPSLFVLIAMSWIAPMGINICLPSIPSIERSLDAPYATVALLISLYMAAMALGQLMFGPLSDRFGRRPVIIVGLALSSAAGIACALAPTIEVLIAARIIQGAGACTGIVLARAIVRDVYDRRHAASMIGYVTMGMAVAPMIAPLLGGVLDDHFGWRMNFLLLALVSGSIAVLVALRLVETAPMVAGRTTQQLLQEFGVLLTIRLFWLYVACVALTSGVYFSFLGAAPLISTEVLELSATQYGAYFIFMALGYIAGNFMSGRFANRMGVKFMVVLGCSLAVFGVALMAIGFVLFGLTVLVLFGPMTILSFANGLSIPSAISGAVSVRPDLAGAASGLTGSIQIGTGALCAFIASYAIERVDGPADPLPLVIMTIVMAVAALLTVLPTPRQGDGKR